MILLIFEIKKIFKNFKNYIDLILFEFYRKYH
jgi:hypothetical protein